MSKEGLKNIIYRIKKHWVKMRLQPIRVFCFHHVSDAYDPLTMWESDWVNTEVLKQWILEMQKKGYMFIALTEAHAKLRHDKLRSKKYAVLTADDGLKSVLTILPWLEEQHIPITLFVNPRYILQGGIGENIASRLDETGGAVNSEDLYLTKDDIRNISSPLVSFAYHGYEHLSERNMQSELFAKNMQLCVELMHGDFQNVVPYYAHTYGIGSRRNDAVLLEHRITPLYVSGGKNYMNTMYIDRELISNERILNKKV